MKSDTPNTSELYASHIPALVTLMKLGWAYRSPARVMAWRGGSTREVLLRPVLMDFSASIASSTRARYPLSGDGIQQVVALSRRPWPRA